jgi:hypothetical protein
MVIHCLWVVGKSKGRGLGGLLVDECVQDARKAGMRGVAMVTSEGNWLAGKRLLESRGFQAVDTAPPSFALMVKSFKPGPQPTFPRDWAARAACHGRGLTIFRSDQCPYLPDATRVLLEAAAKKKVKARVVELRTARDVQTLSPSPYGVFNIVFNGKLLGYHYLLRLISSRRSGDLAPPLFFDISRRLSIIMVRLCGSPRGPASTVERRLNH